MILMVKIIEVRDSFNVTHKMGLWKQILPGLHWQVNCNPFSSGKDERRGTHRCQQDQHIVSEHGVIWNHCCICCSKILSFLQPITSALQSPKFNFLTAYCEAKELKTIIFEEIRKNLAGCTNRLYCILAASIEVMPKKCRIAYRQQHRGNVPWTSNIIEEYLL